MALPAAVFESQGAFGMVVASRAGVSRNRMLLVIVLLAAGIKRAAAGGDRALPAVLALKNQGAVVGDGAPPAAGVEKLR